MLPEYLVNKVDGRHQPNFNAFIQALLDGEKETHIAALEEILSKKQDDEARQALIAFYMAWQHERSLQTKLKQNGQEKSKREDQEKLAPESLSDKDEQNEQVLQEKLESKSLLNEPDRKRIDDIFASTAIENFLPRQIQPQPPPNKHVVIALLNDDEIGQNNDNESQKDQVYLQSAPVDDLLIFQARDAINKYESSKQKKLKRLGRLLGLVFTFAFGFIEVSVTVFLTLSGLAHVAALGIWFIRGVAIFSGCVSSWMMWKVYGERMPDYMIKMFGRGKFFAGFFNWIKPGDKPTPEALNDKQKRWVALFAIIAVIAAIATVSATYVMTQYLAAVIGLSVIGVCLPYVGLVIAAITAFVFTIRLIDGFITMIRDKSITNYFSQMFGEIDKVLTEKGLSDKGKTFTKFVCFAVSALFLVLSLAGLAVACFVFRQTLADILIKVFGMQRKFAGYVAMGVAEGICFMGRLFFTLNEGCDAAVKLCVSIVSGKKLNFNNAELGVALYDSGTQGIAFYALLAMSISKAYSRMCAFVTAVRCFSVDFPSILKGSNNFEEKHNAYKAEFDGLTQLNPNAEDYEFRRFRFSFKEQYAAEKGLFSRSKMHKNLQLPETNLETVKNHIKENPNSRTALIYSEMKISEIKREKAIQDKQNSTLKLNDDEKLNIFNCFHRQQRSERFFSRSKIGNASQTLEGIRKHVESNKSSRSAAICRMMTTEYGIDLLPPKDNSASVT